MAVPNALNPVFDSISFRSSSAVITAGQYYTAATIASDVGTSSFGVGSIYIGTTTGGSVAIFILSQTEPKANGNKTWFQLATP
jgi:hypothetical protein